MSNECCAMMWPHGTYRSVKCHNKAKVEHEGKHYCGTHDPVAIAERNAAKDADRIAKWAKETAANQAKAAAIAEQKRRADCYDDLLTALKTIEAAFVVAVGDKSPYARSALDPARTAIAKATGVKP